MRSLGQKLCIRFAAVLAVATWIAVFWDVTPYMFNVLPPIQGTRMTAAARHRNYLCTELHGGILGKTAILTRHAGKIIILKAQETAVFIRHQNVFNADIASVFLTETFSHSIPLIVCTIICAPCTAGCQLLDITLHHAHLA
jgi:hypothetical protein